MPDSIVKINTVMARIVDELPNIKDAMQWCSKVVKPDTMKSVLALDFDADQKHINAWLGGLLKSEPPPRDIVAFMFGIVELVEPATPDSATKAATKTTKDKNKARTGPRTTRMDLYLAGSDGFDHNDTDFEWAVRPAYFPNGRYAGSEVMRQLGELTRGQSDAAILLPVAYTAASIYQAAEDLGFKKILACAKGKPLQVRAVGVGHDSGDGYLLGMLTNNGWYTPEEMLSPD